MMNKSQLIQEIIKEVEIAFIHATGPGGQNVNKVATACQLRFDVIGSSILTAESKQRLAALAGKRINDQGVLVIEAKRFRSQDKNKEDALTRLSTMIERVSTPIIHRTPTQPTRTSIESRLVQKRIKSKQKKDRSRFVDRESDC